MKNRFLICNTVMAVLFLLFPAWVFAQPTFINKIPIPPLIDAANGTIHLEMQNAFHKFNPGNPSDVLNGGPSQPNGISTYTYNVAGSAAMTILGPTLKWHTYGQTVINVKNTLGVASTTHWHGAELPSFMDGGPHQGISPGDTWTAPNFAVLDSACTMWYHPHYHDLTVQHVQRGLSGMILVEQPNDPLRNTLPHTYGVDDIPVIIGDLGIGLDTANQVYYIDTVKGKRPINLVNGVTNPYVEVPAHMVRLRILNGSTRKGIVFGVSDGYNDPQANLKNFYQIATDGGYTLKPNIMTSLLNGPGARDEIVLDLSNYAVGSTLYLRNLKELLLNSVVGSPLTPPTPGGGGKDSTSGKAFLQLRIIADPPGYTPVTTFTPFTNVWSPGLADTFNVARHRTKQLVMQTDTVSLGPPLKLENMFTIDSTTYEMERIDDTICVGTKEIWTIHNISPIAHPFHIHKIQFRIVDIVDGSGNQIDLESRGLNGPKDDVLVMPGWKVRFLGQFDDYPSPIDHMDCYMYHCHILTHEDHVGGGMMHQFVVANAPACLGVVGVGSENEPPSMKLFPNPSDGVLYLKGHSPMHSTVNILDLHGRRLREQHLHAFDGDTGIDIDGLSNGFYLVEWETPMGTVSGKLVLQRQ